MGDALLRANEWNDLGERIESKPESPLHPRRNGIAVSWQAEAEAVPVHSGLSYRRSEGIDRRLRRREVSVASAEIDHVDPAREKLALPPRNVCERILWEAFEPRSESGH